MIRTRTPAPDLVWVAPQLLLMPPMDKHQDAELEKGLEIDEYIYVDDDSRAQYFEDDGDDIFEEHVAVENEFDYEPEGAFLD